MKNKLRLQYNSPVVLTFSLLCLGALILNFFSLGRTNLLLFSVYHSSLLNPLTYARFFLHVLGHSDYNHFIGNIMIILIVGPALEERYGSRSMLCSILVTALVTGLVQWLFFPDTTLLGASGIVFMMIVMTSLSGMKAGGIPVTLILVLILFVGQEVINGLTLQDNVSQLTHVVGGICGAALGMNLRRG